MMQKWFIYTALLLCFPIKSYGQTHYESNIAIGGKAGTTISWMSFNPTIPQSMLVGTTFGLTFRYIEERHFGLIVELNVDQRGWKETFEGTSYAYQRRLTYLQVPFLTHIYFGNHKFRGFFNAGPEIGYMIGESYSSNFDINNLPNFNDLYRTVEQYTLGVKSKFDYGISAGMGCEYITRNKHSFNLEGRFYFGIGNIFGSSKADYFAASRGMSIMITLGYMYRLK